MRQCKNSSWSIVRPSRLLDFPSPNELLSELDNFVYTQSLYWLEVLSLIGSLYGCLEPILESVIGWVKVSCQTSVQISKLTLEQNKEHIPSKVASFLGGAFQYLSEFIQPVSGGIPHLHMTFLPLKKSE